MLPVVPNTKTTEHCAGVQQTLRSRERAQVRRNTVPGTTQPPTQWTTGPTSQGLKRPGREAEHPPSPTAEVNNAGVIPPTPPPHMSLTLLYQILLGSSHEEIRVERSR
jgi:hypothetical protein